MTRARHSAVSDVSAADIWSRLSDLPSWPRLLHLPYADESVVLVLSSPALGKKSGGESLAHRDPGESLRPAHPEALVGRAAEAGPPAGLGVEFIMKGRLSYRLYARITDWQPEHRFEFEIHRSEYPSDRLTFARAVISITLDPLDDGRTRVTCEHTLEHRGPVGRAYAITVMRPFLKSNVQRIIDGLTATDA